MSLLTTQQAMSAIHTRKLEAAQAQDQRLLDASLTKDDLTRDQLRALRALLDYSNLGFERLNADLRAGRPLASKGRHLHTMLMRFMDERAAEGASDRRPLWRGTILPTAWINAGGWVDPGFVSTTWAEKEVRYFGARTQAQLESIEADETEETVLRIVGCDASGVDMYEVACAHRKLVHDGLMWMIGEEKEVLIAPGTEFAIVSRQHVKHPLGQWVTQLDVLAVKP